MTDVGFEPTDEQRRTVRAMAGFGLPEHDIAVLVRVTVGILREQFKDDLELGAAEGTAKVAQSLFALATREKNVSACIFWMKARAGWSEKTAVEISGKDGEPPIVPAIVIRFIGADDGKPREELRTFGPLIEGKAAT